MVLNPKSPAEELGQTVKYKSILHCFADPIIMLFIGGFILAIAATKSGLDVLLARVMLDLSEHNHDMCYWDSSSLQLSFPCFLVIRLRRP